MKIYYSAGLILFVVMSVFSCTNGKEKKDQPEQSSVVTKDTTTTAPVDSNATAYPLPDISAMDMCYYPVDYTKLKMAKATAKPPLARVIYSRPHLQGRKLFNGILKYGEPWRLGANEATELDLYSDATIQNKKIKAGRYILYCVPQEDKWTIVINTNIDSWGLQPDPEKDIARFPVPARQINNHLEYFTMIFQEVNNGAELIMAWDNTEARLPIRFN